MYHTTSCIYTFHMLLLLVMLRSDSMCIIQPPDYTHSTCYCYWSCCDQTVCVSYNLCLYTLHMLLLLVMLRSDSMCIIQPSACTHSTCYCYWSCCDQTVCVSYNLLSVHIPHATATGHVAIRQYVYHTTSCLYTFHMLLLLVMLRSDIGHLSIDKSMEWIQGLVHRLE